MTNITLAFAVLSVLIPLTGYAFFSLLGAIPGRLPDPSVFIPLLACNAVGLAFSVKSLERSNEKPTNISMTMRTAVFFGAVGLFGNNVVLQLLLAASFHLPVNPTA
ncbi:MAG: hypothetical protein A2010_02785 [Nitrospirae bacterium GWD2_57_9]|nr:MAG: hypothetical protein A2010_02785 [Nitrospirae bacterium GWD2_57_9]OGW51106.1 MAG: hypothetical protein A2078_11305 [Nitrospirae bacterium GWC2_57_9]